MTSCDDNYALLIMPQIASLGVNMAEYDVHFFIFHFRITAKKIEQLKAYAETFRNITLHEIIMENAAAFEPFLKHGGNFPLEAYAYLNCCNQLPQNIDRILYIDAADVIIHGDISAYYFDDFEGKSFIGTPSVFAVAKSDGTFRPFNEADLSNPSHVNAIRQGYINTGSIVLNLTKLRKNSESLMPRYLNALEIVYNAKLEPMLGTKDILFVADQTIMEISFLEDVKFFGHDLMWDIIHTLGGAGSYEYILNLYHPYNYVHSFSGFPDKLWYVPVILHYASGTTPYKPWNLRSNVKDMPHEHILLHKIWWEYASLTPLANPAPIPDKIHEKNIASVNELQFMANWHLTYKRYNEAADYINDGLKLATLNSYSFHALWQLRVRAILENENDAKRYSNAITAIDEYLQKSEPSFMHIHMNHYKGYCYQSKGDYRNAIYAYKESETLMEMYEKGTLPGESMILLPVNPTIVGSGSWVAACENTNVFYPPNAPDEVKNRRIPIRTMIPNQSNLIRIQECYKKLVGERQERP